MIFFHKKLGISSSLTFTPSFFRGVGEKPPVYHTSPLEFLLTRRELRGLMVNVGAIDVLFPLVG